jgi:hypothetical protein
LVIKLPSKSFLTSSLTSVTYDPSDVNDFSILQNNKKTTSDDDKTKRSSRPSTVQAPRGFETCKNLKIDHLVPFFGPHKLPSVPNVMKIARNISFTRTNHCTEFGCNLIQKSNS